MGGLSLPHLIILALVVLILFGRGRISEMMGDFGKGIKSFKEGMADENNRQVPPPPQIQQNQAPQQAPVQPAQAPAQPAAQNDPQSPASSGTTSSGTTGAA
ncbi:twin arginine-targeting protein translocase [Novosphingobium nitrogenifigens DSM 19370]|uniref:Sec-independent protein translocase protein TatA n=1 Tax=Novosphingobium nitrogenifigens DSM 19370 TaxID=983920 RepID=F1ZD92_9SPHN|nr:twin-arginine translocase TatA/TatE family subunit [Novosphingobium nitrogenifigens]EGD57313.1 twin arginine-targeting protein translocase [Novosphingobium nitrogenifigens DSM 19370]